MVLDGYGLNDKTEGNGRYAGDGQVNGRVSFCKRKCIRNGSRTSGGTDG